MSVVETLHEKWQERWCGVVDGVVDEIVSTSRRASEHRELLAADKPLPPGIKSPEKYPTCSHMADVRKAAKALAELPDVMSMEDLAGVDGDRTGAQLTSPDQMCQTFLDEQRDMYAEPKPWPEFGPLVDAIEKRPPEAPLLVWLWTPAMFTEGDQATKRTAGGRVTVTNKLERGEDESAPLFRIEVSLPWWLLAHPDEQRAEVHRLMCQLGIKEVGKDLKPFKRKPELVAYSRHVARYGLPRDPLAASVLAHAVQHPTTKARLQRFGFDAKTKQGLLWSPAKLEDPELDARIQNLRAPVST